MNTRSSWARPGWTLILDVALIAVGYFAAFYLRFHGNIPSANLSAFINDLPYIATLAGVLLWVYQPNIDPWNPLRDSSTSLGVVVVLVNLGTVVLTFWLREFAFPRGVFLVAAPLQFLLLAVAHYAYRHISWAVSGAHHVAVIGNNGEAQDLVNRLRDIAGLPLTVTHSIAGHENGQAFRAVDEADMVFLSAAMKGEFRQSLVACCLEQNKPVYVIPDMYDISLHSAPKARLGDQLLFRIDPLGLSPAQRLVKRIEDLVLGLILAVFTLLVSPFIVVAIKLTSPGPVLYSQERVGLNGKPFCIYKFRTMVPHAEKLTGPVLATRDDPRITRMGRFLRATRLDELPQVFNILKGEMSFVGPRPERPEFVKQYANDLDGYSSRLRVKPGVTGLAQVRGTYDTDTENKLRYDLYYIRHYSLVLDLQILLWTVSTLFLPKAGLGARQARVVARQESGPET